MARMWWLVFFFRPWVVELLDSSAGRWCVISKVAEHDTTYLRASFSKNMFSSQIDCIFFVIVGCLCSKPWTSWLCSPRGHLVIPQSGEHVSDQFLYELFKTWSDSTTRYTGYLGISSMESDQQERQRQGGFPGPWTVTVTPLGKPVKT